MHAAGTPSGRCRRCAPSAPRSPPSTCFPDPRDPARGPSALSSWPTIPQVFVGGELIGGADIVQELAASGELESKLNEKLGDSWRNGGEERTVAVTDREDPFRLAG